MTKIMQAELLKPNTRTVAISDLKYIKTMTPLPELLYGEPLQHPIKVYEYDDLTSYKLGASGQKYYAKRYRVHQGSQRVQAAIRLGYTHISAEIIYE